MLTVSISLYVKHIKWGHYWSAREMSFQWHFPGWPIVALDSTLSYNGSESFKCVIWWALRFPFCVNRFPHISHTNGFSPVWTLICLSSRARRENRLPQIGQDISDFFCWIRIVNDACFLSCWGDRKSSSSEINKKEKVSKSKQNIPKQNAKLLKLHNL